MKRLIWIRTAPPDVPGSMAAYGELVRLAVEPLAEGWETATCDLFHPRGGTSMWKHHLWRLSNARRVLAEHPADIHHWLDGSMAAFMPQRWRGRSVITVHDLIPLLHWRGALPGKPSWPAAGLIRRGLRAWRECAGTCTISHATRADLVRWAEMMTEVRVVPIAVRPLPPPRSIPGFDLPPRYILHVGNNAAYKNRQGVLECFRRLRDVADLHLVVAGPGPGSDLRLPVSTRERVHFIGPVGDAQLSVLYHRAKLLLFPSLYEGFGMPVLEAMAAGCPVVCSTAPALVEVAADAALHAPADDPEALAAQCRALLTDESLRSRMVARGRLRAASFDVASMGRSLLEWYESVLNSLKSKELND